MKMTVHRLFVIALTAIAMHWPSPSSATLITVDWAGTVTSTPFPGTVDVGDTITGGWSYDSTIAGFLGEVQATYFTDHESSFFVNGLTGTFSGETMTVIDSVSGSGPDQIDTRLNSSTGTTYFGDLFSGFAPSSLQVRFTDSTGSVFSDLSLPSVLNASDFDFLGVSFLRFPIPGVGPTTISFRIDSFSAITVPEPSTLALFAIGLTGLGFFGWRQRTV